MNKISIEIVPRNREYFETQIVSIKNNFPEITVLNIPDLLRFDTRSWDAAKIGKNYFPTVIPHLRAIDFNLREPFKLTSFLNENGINYVLIVTGDSPQDISKKVYRNSCLELIRIFKKEAPHIKIYAGLDQYRASFRDELDYIEDKKIAGADGFFTQPFFDIKLLEIYLDLLKEYEIFWGISPVLKETTKNYWESKNNAVFPSHFSPSMDWNIQFAKEAMKIIHSYNSNIYFMPIRINLIEYLDVILKNC